MEWKLAGVRAVLVGLVVVIVILAVTCVLPPMMEDITIEPPQQDDISWSLEGDEIVLRGDVWVNNSGYYPLEDLNIVMEVQGMNRTLFKDNATVESVPADGRTKVPIELRRDKSFFTEEDINTLIFNETTFIVNADMKTQYPFKLLTFDLEYNDEIPWEGIVKELNINEDEANLRGGGQGSQVEIPVDGETTDQLSDTASIALTLSGNRMGQEEETKYSTDQIDITLGGPFSKNVEFWLDESETEEFIFNDLDLEISAELSFRNFNVTTDYTVYHQWDSPVKYLDFRYEDAAVQEVSQGSELTLPFRVHTSDRLTGNASVEVSMYRSSTPNDDPYSGDQIEVMLGVNTSRELTFTLDEQQSEELITNSQSLDFVADVTLEERGVEFQYESSYDWGAPLDELQIEGVYFDPGPQEVRGNISFINDSPRELQLVLNITIYNSANQIVGYKEMSYVTNDSFLVSPGESFMEELSVEISGDATSGEITFTDANTGMEHEREVQL